MHQLVNGQWVSHEFVPKMNKDAYARPESQFRHAIGDAEFPAEAGRYHLYISLACPWAHRTLMVRSLKGLEELISVDVVHPYMGENGWDFNSYPGSRGDSLYAKSYLYQIYTRADPKYSGIVTVPVLWDKKRETIVNNESSEIIRMFNSAFNGLVNDTPDLYPLELKEEIDKVNGDIYAHINNGVYLAGFADSQQSYEAAYNDLFHAMDRIEELLEGKVYLVGNRLTEADIRLFTTLIRFDTVYYGHFKCNHKRVVDYPNLWGYTRRIYHLPGMAETVNLDQIKRHYYTSHPHINPSRIIPAGPQINFGL